MVRDKPVLRLLACVRLPPQLDSGPSNNVPIPNDGAMLPLYWG